MLDQVLSNVVYYDWLLLALLILIIEMLTGTFYMLWLGVAAGVTGVLHWLMPDMPWQMQIVVFAVVSILSMLAWFKYARKQNSVANTSIMNQRGQQYIGKSYPLVQAIQNGSGVVNIDDTRWTVRGAPKAEGEMVTIKAIDGNILEVE